MKQGVPISPKDIAAAKAVVIPPFVFDCFNKCIAEKFCDGQATVLTHVVCTLIKAECTKHNIPFQIEFLNVEEVYKEQGWKVVYDKPAYCESYDAYFVFREK